MTFNDVPSQTIAMLQQHGRFSYHALKRQFAVDDAVLEDLKYELIRVQQRAVDHDGIVLVWTGGASAAATTVPLPSTIVPPFTSRPQPQPLAYTPPYLTEKILASRGALEGERKQVTVLFADLKGSMELLADRDPEEARQLLDPVLTLMMDAVHRYEGTVNQVMGDGIMALFGAPLAHEDHAVRACYAPLRMQEAIGRDAEELRQRQGLDVQIRVGLNSGEVVVRGIDNDLHMDYSAIGQTVHLAARMEQLARPGTTLLTGETLRLVEGTVEVTPLGPVPVKGLPEPITVYELTGAGPLRSRFQAVARGLTRFVGRVGEVEQLRQALGRAAGGHGQVVAIVGEPGVGKSRLVWEVTHSPRVHGWLVLQAGSVSYGKATSYLPVIDLLKRYCTIDDRDGPRAVREKLTGKLVTLDRAQEGSLPALLALLDVPPEDPQWQTLDPPQRRRRTLEAVKRLWLRESQVQPRLLVFAVLAARIDRLAPGDKALLQTASVVGKDVPLALLQAIAEPAEDALYAAIGRLQAAEFLYEAGLFPDLKYTFKHALTHEVTYGSLLQGRRRTLHRQIVEAIERLYPDRLTEHIERLAHHAVRGEAWEKAVTYLRQAGAKALARSANREALASFEQALTALTHRPQTRETHEQAIDLRFDLRTALFPLAEFGRIEGYLREAEALARSLDDQCRLGWVSAYMSGYHLSTGSHASEARTFAQRVEAIGERLSDVPLQVVAQYYLALACYISGDYRATEHACRSLMQSLQGERTREQFGVAAFPAVLSQAWLARALAEHGIFDEGDAHGHDAIQMAEALDHPYSLICACLGLAHLNSVKGSLSQAAHLLERAVTQCREWNITFYTPVAMASLGHVYARSGRLEEGLSWLQQALTAYESTGIGLFHSISVVQLGETYLLADQVEDARACADRAVRLARERGERGHEAWALCLLGDIAAHESRPDVAKAEAHYGAAIALGEELGMRPLAAHCHLGLGTLYTKIGRLERARAELSTASKLYRTMDMAFWIPQAEGALAQVKALIMDGGKDRTLSGE